MNRHRLLLGMQFLNLATGLFMTALLLTNVFVFWHSYIVVFASGLGWALDMPSRRAAVHDLIGGTNVTNGMALDSVGMHASRMSGPALAGGLIALIGVTGGYFVIIGFYVISIVFMCFLKLPPRRASVVSRSIGRNLVEGFAYVQTNRVILATVVITVLMNLLLFPYMQMVPVIATGTLNVGPGLMGILMGADGMGAIIGSVTIASAGRLRHHGRVYLGGSIVGLVMVLMFAGSEVFRIVHGDTVSARFGDGRIRHDAVNDSGNRGARGYARAGPGSNFTRNRGRAGRGPFNRSVGAGHISSVGHRCFRGARTADSRRSGVADAGIARSDSTG